MAITLLNKITGSWTLVELIEVPVDGCEVSYPMGNNPIGLIIYNADGYMSAQIMNPQRKELTDHYLPETGREYWPANATYLAYSGPFKVDEINGTLCHTMYVSINPNWLGQTQKRKARFDADGLLHLESGTPFMANGKLVTHQLTWKRTV